MTRVFSTNAILRWLTVAVVFALIAVFILQPIGKFLFESIRTPAGAFGITNYLDAFSRERHFTAYWNSLKLGLVVTLTCLVIAVPYAWAVERTDIPCRALFKYSVFGAFIIPPYLASVSWILIMNPNSGWLNQLIGLLPFMDGGIFNAFTFSGLAFIIAVSAYPYLYIFVSSALNSISSELEEAASILGSNTFRTLAMITIPLVLPAIMAGSIVIFLEAISLVGTPALIAVPARINLITTELQNFFRPPINVGAAAAFSVPLLVITVALFVLQKAVIGRRKFTTVTGKGGQGHIIALRGWRWPVTIYCIMVVLITFVLPVILLLHSSLAKAWFRLPSPDNFTLDNFRYLLFTHQYAVRSIFNTIIYSAAAATISVLFSIVTAYLIARRLTPFPQLVAVACLLPFVIPGIIIAIAVYTTFAAPPFALYGTMTILIIAFTIRFLPIGLLNTMSGLDRLNPEMEDAVRILGGSRLASLREVVAPLMKSGLLGSWLLIFIVSSRELSSAMFLYVPATRPISITLLDLSEEGVLELLSALGLILLLMTFAVVFVGVRLLGKDFMQLGARK